MTDTVDVPASAAPRDWSLPATPPRPGEVGNMRITRTARLSYAEQHRCPATEANAALRSLMEAFVLAGVPAWRHAGQHGGPMIMRCEGFSVLVSPDRDAVIGYSTVHGERTWAQLKPGTRSRRREALRTQHRTRTYPVIGIPPDRGEDLTGPEAARRLPIAGIHLPRDVVRGYARRFVPDRARLDNTDLCRLITDDLADTLRTGTLSMQTEQRNRTLVARGPERTWFLRPDGLVVHVVFHTRIADARRQQRTDQILVHW